MPLPSILHRISRFATEVATGEDVTLPGPHERRRATVCSVMFGDIPLFCCQFEPTEALGYTPAIMKNTQAYSLQRVRAVDSRFIAVMEILAVAGAIMLAAMIKVPLPWTPVPVTLQTLPVLAAAYVVGRERAMAGILLYLGLGIAGAPLFAVSFGATVGYLLAFIFVPYVTMAFRRPVLGMLAATAMIYALGTAWLCLWAGIGPWTGLMMAVVPFIPADAVKAGLALLVARRASGR